MKPTQNEQDAGRTRCVWCEGSGAIRPTGVLCRTCGGTGRVLVIQGEKS